MAATFSKVRLLGLEPNTYGSKSPLALTQRLKAQAALTPLKNDSALADPERAKVPADWPTLPPPIGRATLALIG